MTKEYAQIRVRKSTQETLRRLAEATGLDYILILEEWTKAIDSILEGFKDFDRLSIYSHKYEKSTDYEGLVLTRLGRIIMTSFPVGNNISNAKAEKLAKSKVKA